MAVLRTTIRRNADGVIGMPRPEAYIHPELGLCSLYLVSGDGVTYWVKWLVSNAPKIIKAKSIPIVVNPVLERGTVLSGTYYAIPASWTDAYLSIYNTSDIPSDYVPIANLRLQQMPDGIAVQQTDNGSGTGTGSGNGGGGGGSNESATTTNTLFSTKNILIVAGIGFLLLLFANKK